MSTIATIDFPTNWQTLLPQITDLITETQKPEIKIILLKTLLSLFQRWKSLYRSDELYTEINYCVKIFGRVFVDLVVETDRLLSIEENTLSSSSRGNGFNTDK